MIAWMTANIGTMVIGLALCAVIAGIIATLMRDKKSGRSSCGGNCGSCGHCSAGGSCHKH